MKPRKTPAQYAQLVFDKMEFTDFEKEQIIRTFALLKVEKHGTRQIVREHILALKEYEVNFDGLYERILEILSLGRDSSSLRSLQLRYGEIEGKNRFDKKNQQCTQTATLWVEKYGEDTAREMLSKRGAKLETYINRHGEEEGRRRWDEYKSKRAASYKKKHDDGYQFARYTVDYYIKLYGEEEGRRRWDEKQKKINYKISKQRYIDEFGPIEGAEICRRIKDTYSLDFCVRKYGPDLGPLKYEEKMEKYAQRKINKTYYSVPAMKLFECIKQHIQDIYYYGCNEKCIVLTKDERDFLKQTMMYVDLFYNDKIIEFYGDVFHGNPNLFTARQHPHPYNRNLTARQLWEYDAKRENILVNRGYKVITVWESDFSNNPTAVIEQCIAFLMEEPE